MLFEPIQRLAFALTQERSLATLLKSLTQAVAEYPGVALVRVWLVGRDEECEICRCKTAHRDRATSLHMSASSGRPLEEKGVPWTAIDGDFHTGSAKIRHIFESAKPLLIRESRDFEESSERPEWIRREHLGSFAGYPLVSGGERLGVLCVVTRMPMQDFDFDRLRILSVALAGTIVNIRALKGIDAVRERLESENAYLRSEIGEARGGSAILGSSPAIRRVLEDVEMVAPTDATVLILGETGVGKELVARAIHERSPRGARALVKVNCTAIPRELFESEFFGHVKGAYSGATADRMGRFQIAEHGSLFLDEIGDLPSDMQPKLLRVLQDGEFQHVGDNRVQHADVRVIAASNHDLRKDTRAGKFREDLFYRLSVFPIEVPPLRQRKEDVPVLADHFIESACRRFNRAPMRLSENQTAQLQNHDWPGNIRELQNTMERAVIAARSGALRLQVNEAPENRPLGAHKNAGAIVTEAEMQRRVRDNLVATLRKTEGRIYGAGGAAELLGVKPTTLTARIKKLGIDKIF